MKNPGKILFLAAVFFGFETPIFAVQITTEIEQSKIAVMDTVILKLKISGAADVAPGKVPQIKNLSVVFRGSSSSFEYINGKSWSGTTLEYAVKPLAEGSFTIPPIMVKADGHTMQSEPVGFTASKDVPPRQQNRFPGFPNIPGFPGFPDEDQVSSPDRTFEIKGSVDVSKKVMYAGEVCIVRYFVSADRGLELNGFEVLPEMTGFIRKDLDEKSDPSTEDARKKVVSFLLIPQSKGTFSIAGGRAVFANGLAQLDFPVQKVTVMDLPSAGRPAGYSGNIGNFTMTAGVTSLSCAAYEERKIIVKISGTGNFLSMHAPVLSADTNDVRVFTEEGEPAIRAEGQTVKGDKSFTLTFVPEKEGTFDLGEISFNYFDPSLGDYKIVKAGPVNVTVKGIAEKKDVIRTSSKTKLSWVIVISAVAGAALFLFGGIILHERRKYGTALDDVETKTDFVEKPADDTRKELSRLKYELTVAIEHNDAAQCMKTAEILINKCSGSSSEIAQVKEALFGYKYGGKTPSKEEMELLRDRIIAAAGY